MKTSSKPSSLRIVLLAALVACAHAENPIEPGIGLCDPHVTIHDGRAYLFATHDASVDSTKYVMHDWWVWSSADLVTWKQESVLKPEDTFLKSPFNDCWATFGAFRNGKCYWYFSAGSQQIGVVVGDSPAGPWTDPLGKPLIPKGWTPTQARDPDILIDDDGTAYMIYGTFNYYIAKLNPDMISLAFAPQPIGFTKFPVMTDDKPSLHKYQGRYYLSWNGAYAVSDTIYGPYTPRGSVMQNRYISPEFQANSVGDRHGNFFTFNNQWYYIVNDKSQPGSNRFFRNSVIAYIHYLDNGDMAPVRLNRIGVGTYDASAQDHIEAEDFFRMEHAIKRESADNGFEIRGISHETSLAYPKVRNLPEKARISFRVSCNAPGGATIQVHSGASDGPILGSIAVGPTGGWTTYQTVSGQLQNQAGTSDITLTFDGTGDEILRLDWMSFK